MLRLVHFPDSGGKSYSASISKELLSVLWEFLWIIASNCVRTGMRFSRRSQATTLSLLLLIVELPFKHCFLNIMEKLADVVVYLLMTKPGYYLQGKQWVSTAHIANLALQQPVFASSFYFRAHKSSLPLFGTPFRNLPLENPYGGVMIGIKLLDNRSPKYVIFFLDLWILGLFFSGLLSCTVANHPASYCIYVNSSSNLTKVLGQKKIFTTKMMINISQKIVITTWELWFDNSYRIVGKASGMVTQLPRSWWCSNISKIRCKMMQKKVAWCIKSKL